MINVFQPAFGEDELNVLRSVFDSNWIGRGKHVIEFESQFASLIHCDNSQLVSTTSCSEGIFASAKLFEFGPEDEIVTSVCCFVATANAIVSSGAKLVACDVDPRSLNVTAKTLRSVITKKTKAVYITHFGGVPTEMDEILDLCKDKKILIIEDAAAAIASSYKGRFCGTLGDLGIWSFDPMKIVSTGDGGMLFAANAIHQKWLREYLYLGYASNMSSGYEIAQQVNCPWWEYEINVPGRRSIMNDIAGAIGKIQLGKLPHFLKRRSEIASRYASELCQIPWLLCPPKTAEHSISNNYFFWIQTQFRNELALYLRDKEIYTTFRYWPIHRVKLFNECLETKQFPGADRASDTTLLLPIHSALSDDQQSFIIESIKNFR